MAYNTNFISRDEAAGLVGEKGVAFVDGSWYLPAQKRDARAEFQHMRIPGAVFFDIDAISDPENDLPHMLPQPGQFAKAASLMGISNDSQIIVYDGPGLFSAARVWWTFKIMGATNVRILSGGFDRWKTDGLPVETGNPNPPDVQIFKADFKPEMVVNQQQLEDALSKGEAVVLDARPSGRFFGSTPEPREGLRSGHMPGAVNIPSGSITEYGSLLPREQLEAVFRSNGIDNQTRVVTSCGSGVTAAILSLALEETGRTRHALYDGSWAEWGRPDGPAIETDEN